MLRGRADSGIQREKHGPEDPPLRKSLFADVFVPDSGITRNIVRQQLDAFVGMGVEDFGAVFTEPVDAAAKIDGLADDNGADAELPNEAAAIPAGSKGGHHDFVSVGALAACFAESICFAVHRWIAFLNSAIVTASQEFSFAIKEGGTDGDSAFGKAEAGFFDGHL